MSWGYFSSVVTTICLFAQAFPALDVPSSVSEINLIVPIISILSILIVLLLNLIV